MFILQAGFTLSKILHDIIASILLHYTSSSFLLLLIHYEIQYVAFLSLSV